MTKPIVEVLLTGEIEIVGRLVAASNATLFGYAELGNQKLSIIYKPRAGERPLWDFPIGTLAGREVSSFLVSQALGWDLVPITLLRDGPYGIGMVQQWIDIDESLDVLTLISQLHPDLRKMVLFDAIINNTDRKFGHLLPTSDGRIRGCDHGVTFHSSDKLRTVLWDWAGEPILPRELEELSGLAQSLLTGDLSESLSQHLTNEEIEVTSQRVARLLDERRFPSPGTQWPAVPWPPF